MKKYIDLHTHSTASDGSFTPTEVVKAAKDAGLSAIALTDHDTIDGLAEATEAGRKYGIEVITGIEFSVTTDTAMHLLGLDFDPDSPAVRGVLDGLVESRDSRNLEVINKLQLLGLDITYDDMMEFATSRVVGKSQIARAMIKKGYCTTINEAFTKYLGKNAPAYAKRNSLSPEKAIEIIKKSGGFTSLAHLNQTKKSDEELYVLLKGLKAAGLDAVEGYYTEYTDDMNVRYRAIAAELGLKLTGGSDFHGANKDGYEIGTGKGNLRIPYELLENIRKG